MVLGGDLLQGTGGQNELFNKNHIFIIQISHPVRYTVGMILRLTEGSMAPVDCVDEELGSCSRMDNCATAVVWKKLNDAISDVIANITLADLVDWQIAKDGDYSI